MVKPNAHFSLLGSGLKSTIVSEEITTSLFMVVSKLSIVSQTSSPNTLMMEAVCSQERLVYFNRNTLPHNPKDCNVHQHSCGNLVLGKTQCLQDGRYMTTYCAVNGLT
jgi:hypothetical protein